MRDIANNFNEEEFRLVINLESISASQISRHLRDLEPEVLKSLFELAIRQVGDHSIRFVTRLKDNAVIEVLKELLIAPISPSSSCYIENRYEVQKADGGLIMIASIKGSKGRYGSLRSKSYQSKYM